jgi:Undecaprenyl-phosphate glucose phosphotransferase
LRDFEQKVTVVREKTPMRARGRPSSKTAALESTNIADSHRRKPAKVSRLSVVRAKVAALEFSAVAISAYVAGALYHIAIGYSPPVLPYIFAALFIAILVSFVSLGFRHFDAIRVVPLHVLLWNGIGAVGLAFSLLLSSMFLLKISEDYSRGTFFCQIVAVILAVIIVRTTRYSWIQSLVASGLLEARHVILIGNDERCNQFSERLAASAIQTVASFRPPWRDRLGTQHDQAVQELVTTCRAIAPDDIIVLASQEELPRTMRLVSVLSELPIGLHIVPVDALELLAGFQIGEFGNLLTIQVHRPPLSSLDLMLKRSFDVVAAIIGLIVLSPIFVFVSIAIKLDSSGPIFFRQTRHGFNNEPLRIFKFRTMTTLEDGDEFRQVVKDDPRVTRLGRLLRQANIDELPQLINVLQGKMSIVGPRPHATAHNKFFEAKIAPFSRRHTVKPGLTGWAQVNGFRGETDTVEKMQRRVEYDLYYIDNWSFFFDMKIILLTLLSRRAYTNAR